MAEKALSEWVSRILRMDTVSVVDVVDVEVVVGEVVVVVTEKILAESCPMSVFLSPMYLASRVLTVQCIAHRI